MITILVGVAAFVAGYAFRGLIHKELGTIGADIKADVAKADTAAKTDLKKL